MANERKCLRVEFGGSSLRVILQDYPGVEASLDEPKPLFNRPDRRGRVSYSICGDLTAAEARAFASNIFKAADIALAWERGDETRETILKTYGGG